tara:strand:+ start:2468 stop:3334 length:867 start_codon:yes stop_codon:yes gene_type:complete
MEKYLSILEEVLQKGVKKSNRTGIDTYSIAGKTFEHDMSEGFPLITTKKIPYHLVTSELEFFIKGITDKQWLKERDNHIWDEWCSPEIIPYAHDKETKERMRQERDLGPIYGFQWRHFGSEYGGYNQDYNGQGTDQLENVIKKLEKDPTDRRMIVTAWNPKDLDKMALPPCHYQFQVTVTDDKLNLMWNQRSVDSMLGLPFNIASYGTLLHLLAKQTGFEEGKLVGFLGDVHIYENHLEGAKKQLSREPFKSPKIETKEFNTIFDWNYEDTELNHYVCHPHIKLEVAV